MKHTKEPDDFCTLCLKRKSSKPNCSKCNPQQRITDLERQLEEAKEKEAILYDWMQVWHEVRGCGVSSADVAKVLDAVVNLQRQATSGEGGVMSVTRFDYTFWENHSNYQAHNYECGHRMEESFDGEYIKHSDYEELQLRTRDLERQLEEAKEKDAVLYEGFAVYSCLTDKRITADMVSDVLDAVVRIQKARIEHKATSGEGKV